MFEEKKKVNSRVDLVRRKNSLQNMGNSIRYFGLVVNSYKSKQCYHTDRNRDPHPSITYTLHMVEGGDEEKKKK